MMHWYLLIWNEQIISAYERQVVIDWLRETHLELTDQELLNAYLEDTFFDELLNEADCIYWSYLPELIRKSKFENN